MKDNKVERVRQKVAMLKQQFLQGDSGLFSQVLGDQEIGRTTRMTLPSSQRLSRWVTTCIGGSLPRASKP